MQENEFEKQVSRLMEEFNLTPSDSVWKKVEQQINKDKRRNRWLIIPLLLSGLTLAGYFTYQALHQSGNNINKNVTAHESQKDAAGKKNNPQKNNDPIGKADILTTTPKEENSFTLKQQTQKPLSKLLRNKKTITNRNLFADTKKYLPSPVLINKSNTKIDNKEIAKFSADAEIKKNRQLIAAENKQEESKIKLLDDENKTPNNSASQKQFSSTEVKDSADSASIATSEYKKLKTFNKNSRKWQWGITSFYGRSDAVETLLGIHFFQDYSAADYLNNSGQQPDSGAIRTSRIIKPSSAFKLGVSVQKQISKRSSISFGVNYVQLRMKTETGIMVDSAINVNVPGLSNRLSVGTFYKPGSGNFNTDTYRFIEIPVIFQHRFNNSSKFPLYYNAGISFTQLIDADALFYDRYNNIFYAENNLLRKTQLQFQLGLNTSLNLKSNTSIFLGPQLQYSLSNLLKNKNFGSQHLFNWGLQANILFHKK